jgi:hypothetical protein
VSHTQTLDAPPDQVFPLLCPTREYDWIDGWSCEIIHSRCGGAEANCVFVTHRGEAREETWIVSRYEPPRAIEFVKMARAGYLVKYDITLAPADGGATHAVWSQTLTGLTEAGNRCVRRFDAAAFHVRFDRVERELNHYLSTGRKLAAA